ncbi:MFS-type transporter [Lecanosticta acicola]|uniref:MFS-type transporter n=1 Tax=Lecanosticta acicola TaxID=111012 RepID=A0AAI9EF84_9PEZI|nr:MFS-type transporter [Lecanosticta acicola]
MSRMPGGPSRTPSAWSKADVGTPYTNTPDAQSVQQEEKVQPGAGLGLQRIVGGKYIEANKEAGLHADHGPLLEIEQDMPLTLIEVIQKDGKDFMELKFANGDCENPYNWNPRYKTFVSYMLNGMTLFIGLATTAYSSGIDSMCEEFGVSSEIGQVGLFLFNFVCAIAPMVLAPFCELVGRKIVYSGAYLCFSLCFIGLALGKNIATILVMRAFLGLFGCVGTILVGGTFDDMYVPRERGKPMAMFSYIAILGTVSAPIYAGFIDLTIGWRWIEGIQGLSNIPLLLCIFVFFPETRGGSALQKRAKLLRKITSDERYVSPIEIETPSLQAMLKASSVKAIRMLATEPVVFAFGVWIAFSWFVVFLFLSVIPITFSEKRGWNEGVSGLPYISLAIGTTLGWAANHLQMRKYDKIVDDPDQRVTPEDRLYGAMWGAVWFPIGLFLYSFTQYGYLPWIAPTISLAPIAFGIYFVFESTYSYTADCYGESASSAIAGQGLMRNTLGAVSPLFASQMFHGMGSQWAGLLLALLGTALSMLAFVMFKWGPTLRARSKAAITY